MLCCISVPPQLNNCLFSPKCERGERERERERVEFNLVLLQPNQDNHILSAHTVPAECNEWDQQWAGRSQWKPGNNFQLQNEAQNEAVPLTEVLNLGFMIRPTVLQSLTLNIFLIILHFIYSLSLDLESFQNNINAFYI